MSPLQGQRYAGSRARIGASAIGGQDAKRGDLIFWKGHVAIVRDHDTIVHANAHHMATAIEGTRGAIDRIEAAGSEIINIKRLGWSFFGSD